MPKLIGHIAEQFNRESDPARVNSARQHLRTDPPRGLIELKWLAAQGSVMSMLYLGEAYDRGTAIEKNIPEAIAWYKRAAASGSPIAEHLLARAYLGLNQNDQAFAALRNAATKEYAPSIYLLGRMYYSGTGVERDTAKGTHYFERAMRLGSLPAKGALAKHLRTRGPNVLGFLRGVWLGFAVRIQFFLVLLTEGIKSERFRM